MSKKEMNVTYVGKEKDYSFLDGKRMSEFLRPMLKDLYVESYGFVHGKEIYRKGGIKHKHYVPIDFIVKEDPNANIEKLDTLEMIKNSVETISQETEPIIRFNNQFYKKRPLEEFSIWNYPGLLVTTHDDPHIITFKENHGGSVTIHEENNNHLSNYQHKILNSQVHKGDPWKVQLILESHNMSPLFEKIVDQINNYYKNSEITSVVTK